ncbi:DEAD-box ATP-dependent RNA helicase 17 [Silene latifolia]|uniref:DEAD-box ATP-dependent RNA helicase 17 n=1 Tax=Silene latifolia TaxID=37657 RepID=UPI003D77BCAE
MLRKTMTAQKSQKQQQQQLKNNTDDVFASCSFSSLGLQSSLCDELKEKLGFESPTQIQAEAIPVILSGRHVLVNAQTGSGKTIVYLAPIIHHLLQRRIQRADGTFALVLVPTRELCTQVYEILQKVLHRYNWIVPGYLMGGENRSKEKARLRKGISILVATPGRLLDHLKHTSSFLHANLQWLIFDEADRILELGFGKEIQEILDVLGSRQNKPLDQESVGSSFQRQNLLLSATLNEKVNHLAKISLKDPVLIGLTEKTLHQSTSPEHHGSVGSRLEQAGSVMDSSTGDYNLPSQLIQRYVKVPCGSRLAVLLSILKNLFERETTQKVVLFFSTCDAVDFHYTLLKEFKWPPGSGSETESKRLFLNCKTLRLHGNMENEERRTTCHAFKTEKSALLLSTDISARGLDFPKVKCIIQYDSPGEATEYVHRVGRTARLGQKGDSLLFLQPIEMEYLQDLEKHGVSLTEYPLLKVLDSFPSYGLKHPGKRFVSVEMHPWVVGLQKTLEGFINAEAKMKNMAKAAFLSWVRAYTAHRGDLKRIFMVKKLHLGHVARSFALKEQPALMGGAVQKQIKKRKKNDLKKTGQSNKKRKVSFRS